MTVSWEKEKKIQDLIPLKISQSLYPRENISIKMKIFTWWMQNLLVSFSLRLMRISLVRGLEFFSKYLLNANSFNLVLTIHLVWIFALNNTLYEDPDWFKLDWKAFWSKIDKNYEIHNSFKNLSMTLTLEEWCTTLQSLACLNADFEKIIINPPFCFFRKHW